MNLWRRRELERALLLLPSAAHANGKEGEKQIYRKREWRTGTVPPSQQSVPSLGLIKTSLSSEGVEEEGSCRIGVVYAHVCLTMENVTTRVKVSKST